MRSLVPSSLRLRLLVLILAILAPLLVVVFVDARRQFRQAESELRNDTQRFAQFVAGDVAQLLDSTRLLFGAICLAHERQLPSADPARMTAFLSSIVEQNPFFASLRIATPDGGTDIVAGPVPARGGPLDRTLARRAMDSNALVVGKFQHHYFENRDVLHLAYSQHADAGTAGGCIVLGALDFAWLEQLLAEERVAGRMSLFPPGMVLNVVARDGTILARYPEAEQWTGQVLPEAPFLWAALESGGDSAETQGVDGVVRTYSFCPVKGSAGELLVSVGQSRDKALASVRHALLLNLDITVGGGVMLLLVAWFGSSIFILRPLDSLVQAVKRVGGGELDARASVTGGPREIENVALAFDTMASALQQREEERCRQEALLVEYGTQLRSLTMEVSLAEERERRRVAIGLHDNIGQLLATCYMKLGRALKKANDSQGSGDILDAKNLVDKAIEETQSLTFELSSPELYSLGLSAALARLCEDLNRQYPALFAFSGGNTSEPLGIDLRVLIYRTAKELLHNAAKHAEARQVTVSLRIRDASALLQVEDDGIGINAQQSFRGFTRNGGFGLFTINERVQTLGGRMAIDSAPGKGTQVRIDFPLSAANPSSRPGQAQVDATSFQPGAGHRSGGIAGNLKPKSRAK